MHTIIVTKLWVEGNDDYGPFARSDTVTFDLSKNFNRWPVLRDPRSTDEDRLDRSAAYADLERRFEAANLTPEGVALGADVDYPEVLAVEHDQPGASTENRFAGGVERSERISEPFALDSESHCCRLAAWQHEAVETIKVGRDAHFANHSAEPREDQPVRFKVTLKSKHPNSDRVAGRAGRRHRAHQPRLLRSSDSSSFRDSIESIAAPSPAEARRTRSGTS